MDRRLLISAFCGALWCVPAHAQSILVQGSGLASGTEFYAICSDGTCVHGSNPTQQSINFTQQVDIAQLTAGPVTFNTCNDPFNGCYLDLTYTISLLGVDQSGNYSFAGTNYFGVIGGQKQSPCGLPSQSPCSSIVDQVSAASFNVTGPVPEPATWAMMLIGFAGIGLAFRKRDYGARLRWKS